MITTDDPQMAARMRVLREHGMRQRYLHETLGYNFRMTDIQAAIGVVQLTRIDQWNRQRQRHAYRLSQQLAGIPGVVTPKTRPGATHVFHQYTITADARDRVVDHLKQQEIGYGIYYPLPIHKQQMYQERGYRDCLPVAERASRTVLSLPVHPALRDVDLDRVAGAVVDATLAAVPQTA